MLPGGGPFMILWEECQLTLVFEVFGSCGGTTMLLVAGELYRTFWLLVVGCVVWVVRLGVVGLLCDFAGLGKVYIW